MAIAGDILIKVAADLAEFSTGMTEAAKKLDEFSKQSKETGDKVTAFIGLVKGAVAALGLGALAREAVQYGEALQKQAADLTTQASALALTTDDLQAYRVASIAAGQQQDVITTAIAKFNVTIGEAQQGSKAQIDALNQLGVKILDGNGKLRSQADLLQEVAQRLLALPEGATRAAAEVALFGKSGQQLNPVLDQLAKGVEQLKKEFTDIIPEATLKQLDELQTRAELSQKKLDSLASQIYAPIKQTFIDGVLALLKEVEAVSYRVGDGLRALGIIDTPRTAAADLARVTAELARTTSELEYITDVQKRASEGGVSQNVLQDFDKRAAQIAQRKKELEDERATLLSIQGQETFAGTLPTVTVTGSRNPAVAGASAGTEDAIKRLNAEAKSARDAFNTLQAGYEKPLDEAQRAVDINKQIDDIVAKLGSKAGAAGYEQQLRTAATARSQAISDFQKLQQAETAADATERKLGDGTVAYQKVMADLQRQLNTHRLSTEAYSRAVKEQTEATSQASLAAKRYDDDVGSLVAGFESAAQQYARANDLFSVGQQGFNAFTTAMGTGLDVLAGKSSATFGQIAGDFALMLAKMAIQAAASSIFKSLFSDSMSLAGTAGSAYFGPVAPAATSGIFGSLSNIFGGGRAGGGSVYPGMSYNVGESGPERFVPTVAGQIVPAGMSGGGGVTINLAMSQTQGASNPTAALEFGRRVRAAVVDVIANEKRPGGTLYARHNA